MDGDDVGMAQFRQRRASRVNRSAKAAFWTHLGRQDLDRDQPVQARLAGFVDGSHPALAQQLQQFVLRELRLQFRDRGRHERRRSGGRLRRAGPA